MPTDLLNVYEFQIKLLQASWVVEDLWPKGQTVPSSGDERPAHENCTVT